MHALIVGSIQVGKSTLIKKVLNRINRPVWGFTTKKESSISVEGFGHPIYIYDPATPLLQTEENLIGYCSAHGSIVYPEVFDQFAEKLQDAPCKESIILMDELGFMESKAAGFCSAVLKHMDGDIPILAAVKNRSTPFLDAVKNHPNCKCFYITEENRDQLAEEVCAFLMEQF